MSEKKKANRNEFRVEDHANQCRVVVVDDSDFSRRAIVKCLQKQKINIVGEASSAEEAKHMIRKTDANIVVSDIVMPDMNGIELAKIFNEGFSEIYFIFVSSLSKERVIVESITSGAVDFIKKPFKDEELQQSVLNVCKRIVDHA